MGVGGKPWGEKKFKKKRGFTIPRPGTRYVCKVPILCEGSRDASPRLEKGDAPSRRRKKGQKERDNGGSIGSELLPNKPVGEERGRSTNAIVIRTGGGGD